MERRKGGGEERREVCEEREVARERKIALLEKKNPLLVDGWLHAEEACVPYLSLPKQLPGYGSGAYMYRVWLGKESP